MTPRPHWVRRLWSGLRFRDAVALTAFPLALLALLLVTSVRDYLRAKRFDDWWSRGQGVAGAFSARLHGLAALPRSLGLRNNFSPGQDDAGVIRLDLPARRWDSLEVEKDGTWAPWLEGELRYGSTMIPVRLRKRGDNSVHWLTDKRTLTPRDEFYKRYRSFALSVKDVVPSYLANRLAGEFGLLAPATEIVPLYVNNRFYGIYRFLETVDESFLRPFDRMPGNIFRGDAAERGEYRKGGPRNLFVNPYLWDRPAVNDRWTAWGPAQLDSLLVDLAGGGFSDHERVMARFDRAEYGRLFAYLLLVGDPFHMDGVHNQLLYEDPSTQRLHPIPWDIRIRDLGRPENLNDLFRELLRDPLVPDAAMREVARSLQDDRFLTLADSLLQAAEGRYHDYLEYDRLRTGLVPPVGEVAETRSILGGNARLLRRWIGDDEVAVAASRVGNAVVLDLETRGLVGANLTALRLTGPSAGPIELRRDSNLNGVLDGADDKIAVQWDSGSGVARVSLPGPVSLYAGWDLKQPGIQPGHVPYRLFVLGVPPGSGVEPELVNRVTGKPAKRVAWVGGTPIREGTAWHPWRTRAPAPRRVSLSGAVRLTETLRIAEGDTLVIAPGTVLRLAPDISIVSRGRVIAEGTASQPIRVLADRSKVPWGTFALQGHGADRSRFGSIEFAEGGGALVDRIEYTGMVNVHRADGVIFDHARFRDNVRSDDTFHAMHAIGVVVRDSRFIRANSDALDMDISGGEIVRNTFEASGGDAIDLMTSTPRIIGNQISGSGDKGISIGEGSRPFVFNNNIERCSIGIEVKDRSAPVLLNNRIVANQIGLRERRKNWRYGGGGWPTIALTKFADNAKPWVRDIFSHVTLASVTGLDSTAGRPSGQEADLSWLYGMFGLVPPGSMEPGLVDRARAGVPTLPLAREWDHLDSAVATLGVPVFRPPGNRDINDLVSRDVYAERYGHLPQSVALGRTRLLLLSSTWTPVDGDTGKMLHVRGVDLDSSAVSWLGSELATPGFDHTFVFVHHLLWWEPDSGGWWRDVHPLLAKARVDAVFSGDLGPVKFATLSRDGVEYFQAAIETEPSLTMLRHRLGSRLLSSQFDDFLEAIVEGDSVEVRVHTVAEVSSGVFTPEHYERVNAPPPPVPLWLKVRRSIDSPIRIAALGLLLVGFSVAFGTGWWWGKRVRRGAAQPSNGNPA